MSAFRRGMSDDDAYDTPSSPMDDSGSTSGKVKHARRIPRPMNSFMVFAKSRRKTLQDRYPNYDNKEISKMLGDEWAKLTDDDKQIYVEEAKRLAEQHKLDYPDWKFTRSTARGKKRRPSVGAGGAGSSLSPVPGERRSSLGSMQGSPSALRHPMRMDLESGRILNRPLATTAPYTMTPPPAFPCFTNNNNNNDSACEDAQCDEPLPPYRNPPSHARLDTVHV
eukprot:m.62752 g.62752  ORF g.62752 m.62752 type:complete len:223 (-) comp13806_c0_seq1:316-984(-)